MSIVVDGIFYADSSDVLDIGSWKCSKSEKSNITGKEIREYYGISSDTSKLPTVARKDKYSILGSGSVAFCTDNGNVYIYNESTDSWDAQ